MSRLSIGIMGAGSIGCYVGGAIAAAEASEVVFVGRPRLREEITEHGLRVKDLAGEPRQVPGSIRFETDPNVLADVDVVLVSVKSAQTEEVAATLSSIVRNETVVASLQNGLRNAEMLRGPLADRTVLAGIVGYNVVSRGEGLFHRTMDGPLVLEASSNPIAVRLFDTIRSSGLELETQADMAPHQWTKLFVNLNNAVSALSDAPTTQILLSPGYRKIVAAIIDEGLAVARACGVRPAKLRGVPVSFMPKVLRMPTPIVRLVTGAQMKVDADARSSMWEDLNRRRPTEVDFLNGEIVRRAEGAGVDAPLNRRVVELVHEAEASGSGSPALSAEALWARLRAPS